jgi:hypothetical protein
MTWVAWRLQRTETLVAAALLAALALLLVPTGIQIASAFDSAHLSRCVTPNSFTCAEAVRSFESRFGALQNLANWFTLLPGIVGALLAAPFVLDLEQGTHRLAWTQSITRRRWLATKLGLAVLAALAVATCLIVLLTWWRAPFVRLDGRMDNSVYDGEGVVPIGYTLFALGLAAAVGALWRRAVPALVVSVVGYFAARIFVDGWLRQRLVTPLHATWKFAKDTPASLRHAWVLNEGPLGHGGKALSKVVAIPCRPGTPGCNAHLPTYMTATYIPPGRFWDLQLLELALFGGVALVLLAFAAWWTHERAA